MTGDLPAGLAYYPGFVADDEERDLAERIAHLTFSEIRMRGQVARRRTAHFGWLYGYESWRIEPGPPVPEFLLPLRQRSAALAGLDADSLAEVLVTEYPAGSGIGWHRDAPMFGTVIGISLLAPCRFRLQSGKGAARETRTLLLEPRSAYVLDGGARWQWQHSIPPITALRYSITFRTLRESSGRRAAASR